MVKIAKKFIGMTAAIIGAILIGWQSVSIFYSISGRILSGQEHPPLIVMTILFAIGLLLFLVGYKIQK